MTKKKQNRIVLGVIIAVAIFFLIQSGSFGGVNDRTLSISPPITNEISLDDCSTVQACINFLESQGMPDNFLEENNYEIRCTNNKCVLIKN